MNTEPQGPQISGCDVCGFVEPQSPFTDNMAHFHNADERTDACLRRCGIHAPVGSEVRLCRRHAVALERELTLEYGAACPYVRPLPHTVPTVGLDTRPRRADLTTWTGDPFLPPATLGPEFRLFGLHRARRITVEFGGRVFTGVWLPDAQDFVRLRVTPRDPLPGCQGDPT